MRDVIYRWSIMPKCLTMKNLKHWIFLKYFVTMSLFCWAERKVVLFWVVSTEAGTWAVWVKGVFGIIDGKSVSWILHAVGIRQKSKCDFTVFHHDSWSGHHILGKIVALRSCYSFIIFPMKTRPILDQKLIEDNRL